MFAHFQSGPRRGRALAAMLVLAAGVFLAVLAADAPSGATTSPASGSATPSASGNTSANSDSQSSPSGDLRAVEYILSLSSEQLAGLRKALENVEKMSPAERDLWRREIQNRRQNLTQLQQEIAADIQQLSPSDRSIVRRYLLTLYPNDIHTLQDRFHAATTPEQRKQIIQEMLKTATDNGIKPQVIERGQSSGSRSGRGGQGTGENGHGAPHSPMPPPAPIPAPAQ